MSAPVVESAAPLWVRRVQTTIVVAVALVAFTGSYSHMKELAAEAGEGWRAWLLPISVDGMILSASLTMFVRRRASQRSGLLAWVTLLVGLGASLAANIASAQPTLDAQALAAVYPIALLAVTELAMQQIKTKTPIRHVPEPTPEPEPSLQDRVAAAQTVNEPAVSLPVAPPPATNVEPAPRPQQSVDDLLPAAEAVAERLGRVPGWKLLARELRADGHACGTPKAQALVVALQASENGDRDGQA